MDRRHQVGVRQVQHAKPRRRVPRDALQHEPRRRPVQGEVAEVELRRRRLAPGRRRVDVVVCVCGVVVVYVVVSGGSSSPPIKRRKRVLRRRRRPDEAFERREGDVVEVAEAGPSGGDVDDVVQGPRRDGGRRGGDLAGVEGHRRDAREAHVLEGLLDPDALRRRQPLDVQQVRPEADLAPPPRDRRLGDGDADARPEVDRVPEVHDRQPGILLERRQQLEDPRRIDRRLFFFFVLAFFVVVFFVFFVSSSSSEVEVVVVRDDLDGAEVAACDGDVVLGLGRAPDGDVEGEGLVAQVDVGEGRLEGLSGEAEGSRQEHAAPGLEAGMGPLPLVCADHAPGRPLVDADDVPAMEEPHLVAAVAVRRQNPRVEELTPPRVRAVPQPRHDDLPGP
mmetsp:Transcript_5230/g.17140  ORF Transcript_5230/g.17140 Transcript_5230/m.17140 type:complete len:392 (+) Transcript_5230:474-1649(+)